MNRNLNLDGSSNRNAMDRNKLHKLLILYANASSLCVNIDKTNVVWIWLVENDKLTFCNQVSETIQHIRWEFKQVTHFWNGFELCCMITVSL